MNEHDRERIKKLLQEALPRVDDGSEPSRDLWPAMLRRLDEEPAPVSASGAGLRWTWIDGALAAGLAVLIVSFPASIPLLLYYL